jgi:hypothetical protein
MVESKRQMAEFQEIQRKEFATIISHLLDDSNCALIDSLGLPVCHAVLGSSVMTDNLIADLESSIMTSVQPAIAGGEVLKYLLISHTPSGFSSHQSVGLDGCG